MTLSTRMSIAAAWICLTAATALAESPGISDAIRSESLRTAAGEIVLVQTADFDAPVADVWAAYTTGEGWMAWAAPAAEVDLRAGGTIRTNYTPGAKVGDPGTNTLHIVNYVPERILTLRAELTADWPEVMKEDDGKLMNVIVFEEVSDRSTRVRSYGVGYRDTPAYNDLMRFFIPANEHLLHKLKEHLER